MRAPALTQSIRERAFSIAAEARVYTASVIERSELLTPLRRYWGFDCFRPLQEDIVRSLLGGHDTCVVMPTGGGKSVCYQLPAAMLAGKTAVVISPLISLMQDQVDQLAQAGIPAAVLNSSLVAARQAEVMCATAEGRFRLLYLSPERLARAETVSWLQGMPLSFFAIDEAHCISEWGHEFRPDYRQLNRLRDHFPQHAIAAFTASATRAVRHDVIHQLRLRQPHKYIASFHRANLRYSVRECDSREQGRLLVRAIGRRGEGSVIVYAPTIKRVEDTVDFLEEHGIAALAYHGQMDAETRRRNQERWMSDDVHVLVGTVAFGLGINKATVRAVIHLSLPKSLEQYYQEAGRAGRDGNPADCVLLWRKADAGLLSHFIHQLDDPAERDRAWQRYRDIRGYAESGRCRHRQICLHFGETPKWTSCQACDVCTGPADWLMESGAPERPRRGHRRPDRRLRAVTGSRAGQGSRESATDDANGQELREYLREWRRTTAKRRGSPAYVVMHDTSLENLCRIRPASLDELLDVPGFGERKVELYGEEILEALRKFQEGSRAVSIQGQSPKPLEETMRLLAEGRSFAEIARARGRQLATVVATTCDLVEQGKVKFQPAWVETKKRLSIEDAADRLGLDRLRPLKDALPPEITFEELRLVVAELRRRRKA